MTPASLAVIGHRTAGSTFLPWRGVVRVNSTLRSTADNDWVVNGPHVIIFVPNIADLAALSSDHKSGGPYVMWQGTPYAHIMMPVAATGDHVIERR